MITKWRGLPKILRKLKLFNFVVDYNIVDTTLNFVLRYLAVSDMSIKIGVHL